MLGTVLVVLLIHAARRPAGLATQPELGLWSSRGVGPHAGPTPGPAFIG